MAFHLPSFFKRGNNANAQTPQNPGGPEGEPGTVSATSIQQPQESGVPAVENPQVNSAYLSEQSKVETYTPQGLNDAISKPASVEQIPASDQNIASTIERATPVQANTLHTSSDNGTA